ncbi:hypothetical protein [Frigoriglobus tundricola]|uniref:Uncharacterized protein n=1 Tax=Frigoriglobus tundricola TaxID=2774151 RepID=A0A6M5YJA0_9BACT|nr:hypothetical protein [Frigoriglobus tundricola]QJW93343.1 hypothetical protein FTUN_0849 [Frigoriglobus tundricola]
MPKTKSKKLRIEDDEDEVPIPELPELIEPIEVIEPVRRAVDTGMILDMEGHGGAVASALIVNGLRAYLSVVNKGVNLVAANRPHTLFVPVKVSACKSELDIKREETTPLVAAGGVLAFLVDDGDEQVAYYIPVAEYLARAGDRGESGLRLEIDAHADWLDQYEGHAGVRRAFAKLLA